MDEDIKLIKRQKKLNEIANEFGLSGLTEMSEAKRYNNFELLEIIGLYICASTDDEIPSEKLNSLKNKLEEIYNKKFKCGNPSIMADHPSGNNKKFYYHFKPE